MKYATGERIAKGVIALLVSAIVVLLVLAVSTETETDHWKTRCQKAGGTYFQDRSGDRVCLAPGITMKGF